MEFVELEGVECVKTTPAALLCLIEGDEHWIPRSQLSDESDDLSEGDIGTIFLADWLAARKGLV